MSNDIDQLLNQGASSPPSANGELIFAAPWESRSFGMARVLCEAGLYEWDDFREFLIEEIDEWQRRNTTAEYHYYDRFLGALQKLLVAREICSEQEIDRLVSEFEARPHGHDH